MLGAVIKAGLAHKVLPLEEIPNEIGIRIFRRK